MHIQAREIFFGGNGMEKTLKVIIEELALEGPHGATWSRITELVRKRDSSCFVFEPTDEILESIKASLLNNGTISKGRGEHFILVDTSLRYQILGVGALPVIYEIPQYMRLLEMIARGRGSGAWSFTLCSAVNVDAKQLFHLTNPLVDFGLVHRKSNVIIPRKNRSALSTGASTATFFIHSKFASSPTDPEIAGIVETSESAESVVTLITTLLRESGGVMTSKTLRRTVVVVGGFLSKQYARGRQKLIEFGRIEPVYIPSRSDELDLSDDDDCDDESEDKKKVALGHVLAYKLVEESRKPGTSLENIDEDVAVKEDPEESFEDDNPETQEPDDKLVEIRMEARNFLKSNFSFPDAVLMIIQTSGDAGVTTRDIARITGIAAKEVSKVLETLRVDSRIFCEWKNQGRKKFILYKWSLHPPLVVKVEDDPDQPMMTTPPLTPMSALSGGSGYVTAATVRRGTYVGEILTSRNGAMSVIDLGRAIEAKEMADGIGIPNTTIDRRTLRKICDIANFPIIEKTEFNSQLPSNTTKLMIVYDQKMLTPEQAAQRVDRPIGLTPKSEQIVVIKSPEERKIQIMDIEEIHRKSRLAAIAVFGNEQSTKIPVSVQVASIYGYISADIYKARMLHRYLVSSSGEHAKFRLQTLLNNFDLLTYLKVLGCGVLNSEIDSAFNDMKSGLLNMRISEIDSQVPSLRLHLKNSVMGGNTETSHLSRILLPLVRLRLLQVDKEGYTLMSSAVVEGVDGVGETVVVDISTPDGVEEYWRVLYKYCLNFKHRDDSPTSSIYQTFPALLKMGQWRSRIVLSLTQRRVLEKFLRHLISLKKSVLVDGSNEELVAICVESKIEVAVALKALSGLLKVIGDDKSKSRIVFAQVMQARFCCHVCSKIFFQFHSVKSHYQQVHNAIDLPDDPEMYTRQEYMEAVERLRQSGGGSKRSRRRNRKSKIFENEVSQERDWRDTIVLAKELLGENGRGLLWQLVAQIRGIEKVPEMIVQRLTQEPVSRGERERVPSLVADDDRYQAVVNMLVFNTVVVDSDLSVVEKILTINQMDSRLVMERLGKMHAEGQLARSGKSMTPTSILSSKTYVPSRVLKLKLFGKFGEVEKFLVTRNEPSNMSTVIECEEAIEGTANAFYINRELYFDIGGKTADDDDEEEDEGIDQDDETTGTKSHTGIRKHLELSDCDIGGEITRVEVADTKGGADGKQLMFYRNILENFQHSNIWRPTRIEVMDETVSKMVVDFVEPNSLTHLGELMGCGKICEDDCLRGIENLHTCTPEMIRLLEVLQLVSVSNKGGIVGIKELNPDVVWMTATSHEVSDFGRFLASLDLRWFSYYYCSWSNQSGLRRIRDGFGMEERPRMRVASFTSVDGFINEQLIRDIMINVLLSISLAPGLLVGDLVERMGGVIPPGEMDLILSSLAKLRLIYQDDKEWFIDTHSNW
jgi:hypothetical protein